MESVTGIAPAFSVRETVFLLLEDTDKLQTSWGSRSGHARRFQLVVQRTAALTAPSRLATKRFTAASTHGAPAEAGPVEDLAIIDEGALCYRRNGCPLVATLWPL